ncbi:hypothetical protein EJ03DRAFT_383828 [Teratosphaeria nubilosa]|uniref:2EXR domain-containing protein n=1 Tax=Teratosphaeria nubilosa TaxID=161662 RepID=A0A6G1L5C2_9PEZI|nr:hypothetical protein EJ03DRAFT_383828 [Teratosphaeria nubilosa]
MEKSIFATLPPELRNNVYELTLQHTCVTISWRDERRAIVWSGEKARKSHPLAILETCRTIRGEATQLFYAINRFDLLGAEDEDKREMLEAFFTQIGRKNVKALQIPLTVHLGRYNMEDLESSENHLSRAMARLLFSVEVHTELQSVKVKATGTGAWWDSPLLGSQGQTTIELPLWKDEDIKGLQYEARRAIERAKAPVTGLRDLESLSEHYKRLENQFCRALCLLAAAIWLAEYRRAKVIESLQKELAAAETRLAVAKAASEARKKC